MSRQATAPDRLDVQDDRVDRVDRVDVAGAAERGRPGTWSPALLAVIALAWAVAVGAEATGHAHTVHHHELLGGDGAVLGAVGLFLLAWPVHLVAMMLPSSLPLVGLFRRITAAQDRRRTALTAFLAGYGVLWTLFGLAAFAGDAAVHEVGHRWSWLEARPHLLAGVTLVVAGAFQFSDLKERCLRECRHPAVFLQRHYRRGPGPAFALGWRHGVFCLGCCWALMVVMFAVGIANLAWMAPFALLMLYEKAGAHGDRAVVPVGVVLVGLGGLVLAAPGWLPPLVPG